MWYVSCLLFVACFPCFKKKEAYEITLFYLTRPLRSVTCAATEYSLLLPHNV
jgi:hypothetical protein